VQPIALLLHHKIFIESINLTACPLIKCPIWQTIS
jgi:hypothetical protein